MKTRVCAIEVSHWHSVFDPSYLRQLARMPDVELVAVQDPDAAVAAKRAAEVGGPECFTDYRIMLEQTRPDFVVVLGRHSEMAEKAHWLLDHGFPFMLEKPMGRDAEEVRGIVEKARAKNAFVALPTPMRFTPFFARARVMFAENRFGPLSHIYVRINGFSSARYGRWDSAWMYDPATACGGALRNLGVHALDLFRLFANESAEVTGAQTSNRIHQRAVEDYASVLLRTPSGVLGTVEVGSTYPRSSTEGKGPPSRDRLLDGADGEFKILGRDAMLVSKGGELRIVTAEGEETMPGTPQQMPSYSILRDVLERWRRGEPPSAGAQDCYEAVRLIDDAYGMAAAAKR